MKTNTSRVAEVRLSLEYAAISVFLSLICSLIYSSTQHPEEPRAHVQGYESREGTELRKACGVNTQLEKLNSTSGQCSLGRSEWRLD